MSDLKKSAISGVFWVMTERVTIQFVNFFVSIILARLLLPKDFGIVGIVVVFTSIAQVIIDGGLANSLIRTKNPQPVDYSVVFLNNFVVSVFAYAILFFLAPTISRYFNLPQLSSLVRVLSLVLIIRAVSSIQITKLTVDMNFKKHFTIQLPSVLAGGIVGVIMAYRGYGVWSLAGSQLVGAFFLSTQLWIRSNWKPKLIFDKQVFKKHFLYGSNLMGAQMIKTLFENIFNFVVAKVYTPVELGFYSRANALKQIPVETFSVALSKVTFPLFSKLQDDVSRLRSAYSKITQQVNYVTAPVFIFLIALAEPLFRFLFTEKWLPAVPYFRLLCIAGMIAPYNYYNVNILNARGKATLLFRLEFIKRVVLGCGIFIVYRYGMFALIYLQTSYLFFAFLLNAIFAGKELQLSLWQQVKPMIPILLCALFSGCVVWLLDSLHFIGSDFFRLLVYGSLFLFLFITISLAFKIEAAKESIKLIIAAIKKVRHKWGLQFSV
jgi:O-antigen/teichoic acid export membrane protein